jgi:hypothetical protein
MSDKRLFSVDEANALIPELELRFGKVMQLRSQLRTTYHELEALGAPPTGDPPQSENAPPDVIRLRARFSLLMEALTDELHAVEAIGVAVKDLDIGLCDFLGVRQGREVWLCWRFGEKRIAFWHDLEAGFAGRQPIDDEPHVPAHRQLPPN